MTIVGDHPGRRQAAGKVGGAGGIPREFGVIAEAAQGLVKNLAGFALGPSVLGGLGDLEGRLGVAGCGIAAGEGDAGVEDQGVGEE
jgi:hypothetical protein